MFEDLIRKNRELKKDCPYCNTTAVMHYGLNEYRKDYGKGDICAYDQRSHCMKCGKLWTINYDAQMNISKIDDGSITYV